MFLYSFIGDDLLSVDKPSFSASTQSIIRSPSPDRRFVAWFPTVGATKHIGGRKSVQCLAVDQINRHMAITTVASGPGAVRQPSDLYVFDVPWLFAWSVETHRFSPIETRRAVLCMTMIRSLAHEIPLHLLPNELLFEIFHWM
jgi:hypothetical protein